MNDYTEYKTMVEIGSLSSLLTPRNQSYVLNTINALLFGQQTSKEQREETKKTSVDHII